MSECSFRNEIVTAILIRVSQKRFGFAISAVLHWPLVLGAEVPEKPGKHNLVCSNHCEGGRLTNHHDCAATFDFPQAVSKDLELHHSEHTHKTQVTWCRTWTRKDARTSALTKRWTMDQVPDVVFPKHGPTFGPRLWCSTMLSRDAWNSSIHRSGQCSYQ